MLATRAADASCALVYVNQVGGQDELVFDGASLVVDADGELVARAAQFAEALLVVDLDVRPGVPQAPARPAGRRQRRAPRRGRGHRAARRGRPRRRAASSPPRSSPVAEVYEALVLGTRDYVTKNGFTDVVIGLSGGIDSSLVACIAADALGPEHVHGVAMPSRYSSDGSAHRRRGAGRQPRRRPPAHRHRGGLRRLPRPAGAVVRGPRARPHRGEPPEPHPGHAADGAVEQVRLAGAHHRQQERDGRRLLHALRRHGRRLRRHQGRAQAARVPALRPRQRRGPGREVDPRGGVHQAAVGRAAPRPARRPEPAALRGARPDHRGLRRARPHRRRADRATASTRRPCAASPA